MIVCQIPVPPNGNGFATVSRLGLEQGSEKILIACQNLPDVPGGLAGVLPIISMDAVGFDAQRIGNIQSAVEVVFLGYDDDLLGLKNILCPINAFVCGKTGMIHENVCRSDVVVDGVLLHALHFVVCHGAGWARIKVAGKTLNLVSLHTWPQQNHFNCKGAAPEVIKASAERGEGDMYREQELKWICEHTILTDEKASENLWLMAGDFNAVSPKDNWVYRLPENSTKLLTHKYILENTPYVDVIWERNPRNFYTTTFEKKRIDFVYCTPALYDVMTDAQIVEDEYTRPVRSEKVKSWQYPSDHLPIIAIFKF